jgi:hypothetical protein
MTHTTTPKTHALRLCALAALLAASTQAAHAGGVSVGLDIGVPVLGSAVYAAGGPVGMISVRGGHGGGVYRGGYYRGGGWGWGWGLGLPWIVPAVVIASQPATVVVEQQPPQPVAVPLPPAPPARPDPVIYPRNGQTAQQLEADRQECNRWATTQAGALTDSSVFMRAVDACMDGRGYTTK